jgi:hypothetical protein
MPLKGNKVYYNEKQVKYPDLLTESMTIYGSKQGNKPDKKTKKEKN